MRSPVILTGQQKNVQMFGVPEFGVPFAVVAQIFHKKPVSLGPSQAEHTVGPGRQAMP